ncbi:hypothetical protein DB35_10370 [Streptomyces abyssalis]|uniref:ABC transporter permease n=1 Tax=Streptomyces abyssalis TaxID=933944 RepID=A0A1E7JHX4_9ACTN|nr:hypothetical protein [Streptomyces abyssalis]OEU86076.1 hypothetical protein AN215_27530 [Streptomyces abyssalis]OEU92458.1 hypothetical protein DB35_10370 [Streptomyces abyssalis]OEV06212.1 hypothetical protein AN219_35290 [Streptomyces nanshensis]
MSSTPTKARTPAPAPAGAERRGTRFGTVLQVHRTALWIWIAFVVISAAFLLWLRYGPDASAAAQFQAECETLTRTGRCSAFSDDAAAVRWYEYIGTDLVSLLRNLPPVVAGWAAAVLIGRELENGTAELAWTQSISPARWLAEKLVVPAVFITAGTGLLVLGLRGFIDWTAAHRLLAAGYQTNDAFFALGPSLVAHALLGLAAGVLAALLTRRMLPALAAGALTTWAVAWLVNPWRTEIWPAVARTAKGEGPFGFTAWACKYDQADHKYSVDACMGARPASNFWPAQLTETGFVLLLAVLVVAGAFWCLRRRTG